MNQDKQIYYLIKLYYQLQKHRIALGHQIRELKERKEDIYPLDIFFKEIYDEEKKIVFYLKKYLKDKSIWKEFLLKTKGIGPVLGAGLISLIDIEKTKHASSVWKYAGLSPDQKRKKGFRVDYNPFLKALCWKIGESFVKTKGIYREIYDSSKEFYQKKFPKMKTINKKKYYTKSHIHNMAKRRTIKRFLSETWAKWREMENLPITPPYSHKTENKPLKQRKPKSIKRAKYKKKTRTKKRATQAKKTKTKKRAKLS